MPSKQIGILKPLKNMVNVMTVKRQSKTKPKNLAEKRTKTLLIRVSPSEYEALQKRKIGRELSTWIRAVALEQGIPNKPKTVDKVFSYEIHKIGVNLNQLTKVVNALSDDRAKAHHLHYLSVIDKQLTALYRMAQMGKLDSKPDNKPDSQNTKGGDDDC